VVQHLDLSVEIAHRVVQPGQHFLARVTESFDPYLREPWIPVRKRGSVITIERPIGVGYQPGQIVSLFGPIGRGLPLRDAMRTLLLIAHDATPASLLMLADQAIQNQVAVVLVLAGEARSYPIDALPPEIEVIRGDAHGNWLHMNESVTWADQVLAVAPPPHDVPHYRHLLDVIRAARTEVPRGFVYGLFQPPMPCGVGACGACLLRAHGHEVYTCLDGPAFDLLDITLG
jgi:dihydroorotate dehydrogenase electron transfer subunit